jgi:hypothetical protein
MMTEKNKLIKTAQTSFILLYLFDTILGKL